MQHEAAEAARIAHARTFVAYGEDMERVYVFKYLGRLLTNDNNDSHVKRPQQEMQLINVL